MKLKINCGISSDNQSANAVEDEIEKAKLAIDNHVDYISNISIYEPLVKTFWNKLSHLDLKSSALCSVPLYESILLDEPILDVVKRHVEEYGVKAFTLHMTSTDLIKRAIADEFTINSRGGMFLVEMLNKSNKHINPNEAEFDKIIQICQENNIKMYLGTCLRPGKVDFCPKINDLVLEDLKTARSFYDVLAQHGIESEVECMGHIHPSQLSSYKYYFGDRKICSMGPLVTDSTNGYDDLNALMGWHLAMDIGLNISTVCIITRSEHIKIPTFEDDLDAITKWKTYTYLYELTHSTFCTSAAQSLEMKCISKMSRQRTQCSAHVNIFGEMDIPEHCNVCGSHCPLEMKKKNLI